MKVLISDSLSPEGIEVLTRNDIQADLKTNLSNEEIIDCISEYDGLIIRSGTQVTAEIIEAGKNLQVIGRAGVGVDNIDIDKATEKGIMVLNAPSGNTISAAEHTIALMTCMARNIPAANCSLKSGKWDRNLFMGVELYNKTLGVVGLGRVGGEVCKRAKAMSMDVIGYDPYITNERAERMGVKLVSLEEIYQQADFMSLHLPKTKTTYHMIGEKELAMMKDSMRIINCARGGLINEEALYQALKSGKIAAAALDVFENEPSTDSPLLELDNVIVTPHLGASTREAQVNVAVQVVEQVVLALRGEPVITAVNVPSIPPETMEEVKPFIPLMKTMGSFYMQVYNGKIESIEIEYGGDISNFPVSPLTTSFLIGILSVVLNESVNYVNAPLIAKQREIKVKEVKVKSIENFASLITVKIKTTKSEKTVAGTLFHKNETRIVEIDKFRIDVVPSKYMLVTTYIDKPGVIGRVGTMLGENDINIAGMQVGRQSIGGEAVMVLQVDNPMEDELLKKLESIDAILTTRFVKL